MKGIRVAGLESRARFGVSVRRGTSVIAALALTLICLTGSAFGEDGEENPEALIPLNAITNGAEKQDFTSQLSHPQAAAELPHNSLDRPRALDLLRSVFGPVLQSPAGPFDELHVDKFLSDTVALIAPGDLPNSEGLIVGPDSQDESNQPVLIQSTLPLRTENSDGQNSVVDLGLDSENGQLEATNPIVPVTIPGNLDEKISLPESEIEIGIAEAAGERSPSITDASIAFYPNTAVDTDIAIAPTPIGVETFTQLRTPDAPTTQTLDLTLPDGATLTPIGGGAQVSTGERILATIPAPTAMDAAGEDVPVSLSVSGDSLVLDVSPADTASYPILVDPLIETWTWMGSGSSAGIETTATPGDWKSQRNTTAFWTSNHFDKPGKESVLGLYIGTGAAGTVAPNSQASWSYYVPRYESDFTKYGSRPTSWLTHMTLHNFGFYTGPSTPNPYLFAGIWKETGDWASVLSVGGNQGQLTNMEYWYEFPNPGESQAAKYGRVMFISFESGANMPRDIFVGTALTYLTDPESPSGTVTSPSQWFGNQQTAGLPFSFSDPGLGVYSATVSDRQSPMHSWTTSPQCMGIASKPCPRVWSAATSQASPLTFDPSLLPQGTNILDIKAIDPLNHLSSTTATVRVDHSSPELSLTGSATEQGTLGSTRPKYHLTATASDGTTNAPQSGIAYTSIEVDGKEAAKKLTNCTTQNCSAVLDWDLLASSYATGSHTVTVKATDTAGNSTIKSLTVQLNPDITVPKLSISGALKSAPGGWINDPGTYSASAIATDSGYGVTSLKLQVDNTTVKEVTQSCPNGGCAFNYSFSVSASSYKPGQHSAVLSASDGAKKVTSTSWTFNVNPVETTTAVGASAVSDALIDGSGMPSASSTIGQIPYEPSLEEEVEPSEEEAGTEDLSVVGAGISGAISLSPSEGVSVSGLNGLPLVMAFSDGVTGATGQPIAGGDGIAYPNVWGGADLITRPSRNGIDNYLVFRNQAAVHSIGWEMLSIDPLSLAKRADGGIDITIDPEIAVPDAMASEPGKLTGEPQVVASIAPPHVIDGAGKEVPASFTVAGSQLLLTVAVEAATVYPIDAEVPLHIVGPISGWYPEGGEPNSPSTEPLAGIGYDESGEPLPVAGSWAVNSEGTVITSTVKNPLNQLVQTPVALSPQPGSTFESVIVHAPIDLFAPVNSEATSSGAGYVQCVGTGPFAPYFYGLGLQTYGIVTCGLTGQRPPNFVGIDGGVCLEKRWKLNGVFIWNPEKCNWGGTTSANWSVNWFATRNCDNGLWKGKTYFVLKYAKPYFTESLTGITKCN